MLRKRLAVEFEIKKITKAKIFSWHRGGIFRKRNFYLPTEIYSWSSKENKNGKPTFSSTSIAIEVF
jgi:hypothetical protein